MRHKLQTLGPKGSKNSGRGRRLPSPTQVLTTLLSKHLCVDLSKDAIPYFASVRKWSKCEGPSACVSRQKMVYITVQNWILAQPLPATPFLKREKDGWPTCCKKLQKWIGSPQGNQAVLTVLASWRDSVVKDSQPDFDPITEPSSVLVSPDLITEIANAVPRRWMFKPTDLPSPEHRFRSKRGPNQMNALSECIIDLHVLVEKQPEVLEHIFKYLQAHGKREAWNQLLACKIQGFNTPSAYTATGRVSFKRERGGKVRNFAILDWWTQWALRPLHDRLMKTLSNEPGTDGTYDQDLAANTVKRWTAEGEYLSSCDLTAATDRFPVTVITGVLATITKSNDFAKSWENLISDRNFEVTGRPSIRWAVGQPLGAYSSWATFALAHHCVVRAAAKRIGEVNPKYVILGDDVTLCGKKLADEYKSIMISLGVTFSQSKSVEGYSKAEFAKRLFVEGKEISPIPRKLVRMSVSNYLLSFTLSQHLIHKTAHTPSGSCAGTDLCQVLGYKSNTLRKAKILLGSPFSGNGVFSSTPHPPWSEVVDIENPLWEQSSLVAKTVRLNSQIQQYQQSIHTTFTSLQRYCARHLSSVPEASQAHTPFRAIRDNTLSRKAQMDKDIGLMYDPSLYMTYEDISNSFTNFDLDVTGEQKSLTKKRIAEARIVLDTYDAFKAFVESSIRNGKADALSGAYGLRHLFYPPMKHNMH